MTVEHLDERLEALERQVAELRRELRDAVYKGNPKSHPIELVYGAMQKYPEWDEVVRLDQEARKEDRVQDNEP